MTKARRSFISKEVLSYLIDNDQFLAFKISIEADKIAKYAGVTAEEVKEFLDPWVKYTPKEKALQSGES